MSELNRILEKSLERKASDIHLGVGSVPAVRIHGRLIFLDGFAPLSVEDLKEVTRSVLTEQEYQDLQSGKEVDALFGIGNGCRYRINAFQALRGPGLALRVIPEILPRMSELGLPESLVEAVRSVHGLILIAGPTGSGKTTTVAALIDHINANDEKHVITLEEGIEFIHNNKRSFITQRSIGPYGHSASFAQAVVAAMREDPNVIMIGDLREPLTTALTLSAAETGHLVIAQIHAGSAASALNRILASFSSTDQPQVQEQLAEQLLCIAVQRLVPMIGGGRILAVELLMNSHAIKSHIRSNTISAVEDTIRMSRKDGMFLMEDHLAELTRKGAVEWSVARKFLTTKTVASRQ